MVENLRKETGHLLLLDSGGGFPRYNQDYRLSARYLVRAMDQMGYAAMNLGVSELYAGVDFLKEVTAGIRFPLISSNLVRNDGQAPFWDQYVIVDVEGIKVGILGVMPEYDWKHADDPEFPGNLKILSPEAALETLVPTVAKEADVVILLSQCDINETTALVEAVKGIDFAVCPGRRFFGCDDDGQRENETDLLHTGRYASLGFMQFSIDGNKQAQSLAKKMISLGTPVPMENMVSEMFNEIRSLRSQAGTRSKEAQARAMSTLQLTPEEFFKQMQQERPEALLIME
jgi:5'-nucleotidase / UDP-sugar diphosphatase